VKAVVGSDERTALTDAIVDDLAARGYEVSLVGPPAGEAKEWAQVGAEVGARAAACAVDLAVLLCWTGTGASIAANKVAGARAALCTDAETARGARKWNDANVLVMSLRLATPALAHEMIDAFIETDPDPTERANVDRLERARDRDEKT
jgi:ribose 5-phosphate isomerase B